MNIHIKLPPPNWVPPQPSAQAVVEAPLVQAPIVETPKAEPLFPWQQQLRAIFEVGDLLHIKLIHGTRTWTDAEGGIHEEMKEHWVSYDGVEATLDTQLKGYEADGWNIFVCIAVFDAAKMLPILDANSKGAKLRRRVVDNIATVDGRHVIRTVAIECDKNGEASLAKVHEAVAAGTVPPPTLVIRSSTPPPGTDGFAKYHFWWAVKDFALEQQEAMNSALQQAFGGDIAAKDTVRVLRLAGFANQKRKYPHKPVATIVESSAGRYTVGQFKLSLDVKPSGGTRPKASADYIEFVAAQIEENAHKAGFELGSVGPWQETGFQWVQKECPNATAHTTGGRDGSCVRVMASGAREFSCLHGHCRKNDPTEGSTLLNWAWFKNHLDELADEKLDWSEDKTLILSDAKTELASTEINPADILEGVDPDIVSECVPPLEFLDAVPREVAQLILKREMRALGITVADEEPEQPSNTEVVLEMPQSALASTRLGDIYANLFEPNEFPLDWALPALVTAASTLVPPLAEPVSGTMIRGDDNMVNLYTALVSRFGAGKTSVIEWAAKSLDIWNAPLSPHYVEGKWGSAEQMFHYLCKNIEKFRNNILVNPDELAHVFAKAGIPNASFATILTTSYYRRRQTITIARNKELSLNHALSLIGGVVDEQFGTVFGSSTIGGLWDRFLFGEAPDPSFQWIHRDYPRPLSNTPLFTPVSVSSDGSVTEVERAWRKDNSGLGRVVEICIRIAKIYASVDGRQVITGKDLEVLKGLAMRQKAIREMRQPNAGTNPDAMFANAVTGWLGVHTQGEWVNIRKLKDGIHSYRMQLGPGVAERCLQVMARSEDIEIWTPTGKDGKDQPLPVGYSGARPRVGLVRLPRSGRAPSPAKPATSTTN